MEAAAVAIAARGLTKRYGSTAAVDGLDFQIARGAAYGLLGRNGAGKTTTLKLLMGIVRPSAGRATVVGYDIRRSRPQVCQRVGYVPERQYIYRWMRVQDVLWFARSQYRRWNRELCERLVRMFELDLNKKVRQLSLGMAAKLSLLLAVAHEPELLLLDEPTAGLDPVVRRDLVEAIDDIVRRQGATVLFSSHMIDDVQSLASEVGIMHRGKMLVSTDLRRLAATTKRIVATSSAEDRPLDPPPNVIWRQARDRRFEWTVAEFTPAVVDEIRRQNQNLEHIEVRDLELEQIFRDYVLGADCRT